MEEEIKKNTFGEQLELFRKRSEDKRGPGALSQRRLGEEIGAASFHSNAITEDVIFKLEHNKTKGRYQERRLVVAIIKALVKNKGIVCLEEANYLLKLSQNPPLSPQEIEEIENWSKVKLIPPHPAPVTPAPILYERTEMFRGVFEEEKGNYTVAPLPKDENHQARAIIGLVPPAPTIYVGREADMLVLKKRIGIGGASEPGLQVITAMRGWPGVGKTTTAAALAHDPEVIHHFKDGILWTSLGMDPPVLSKLTEWGHALGYPEILASHDVENASAQLRSILLEKQVLLIVDDVWNADDFKYFRVGGSGCSMIVTTRETALANIIATPGQIHPLRVLDDKDSLKLLSIIAPDVYKSHYTDCVALVEDLEGLPLALRVAGSLLHTEYSSGLPVESVFKEIKNGALLLKSAVPIEKMDLLKESTPSVASVLFTSLDHLDEKTRECYARLSVFAETPATFTLENIRYIWKDQLAEPIIKELVGHGLLEYVPEINRYQMHALLVKLASSLLKD